MRLGAVLEHEDGTGDLTGLHRSEGFVDVLQLAADRNHFVQLEDAVVVKGCVEN